MARPSQLWMKLDSEGYDGLGWFKPEEFEDNPELRALFTTASDAYLSFVEDFGDLMDYLDRAMEENEIANPDPGTGV